MGREAKIDEIFKSTDDTGKEQVDEVAVEYRYDEKGTWRNLRLAKPLSIAAQVGETLIVPVHETAVHPIKNYLNQMINGTRPKKQPNKLQNQTNWSPEMLFARLDIQNEPVGAKLDIPSTGTSCPEKPEPANYEEEFRNLIKAATGNNKIRFQIWSKSYGIWTYRDPAATLLEDAIKRMRGSADSFSYRTTPLNKTAEGAYILMTIQTISDPHFCRVGFEKPHDAEVFIRFLNALPKNIGLFNEFLGCEWKNNELDLWRR